MRANDTKLPCSRETKRKYELIKGEAGISFTVAVDKAVELLAEKLGVRLHPSGDVQQSAGTPTH